jgi:hypothetical protein
MAFAPVAFPLKHKRPYGVAATFFTFLLAFAEFAGILYAASTYFGIVLTTKSLVEVLLPCAYLVGAASAATMFVVTRGRSKEITRDLHLERPSDLEGRRMEVVRDLRRLKNEDRSRF